MVKLGDKIKQARKIRRITQEELAQVVGVSDKSISAYESDRINPPLNVLEKIAETTEQSLSYFLDDNPESAILNKLKDIEKQFKEIKELLKSK